MTSWLVRVIVTVSQPFEARGNWCEIVLRQWVALFHGLVGRNLGVKLADRTRAFQVIALQAQGEVNMMKKHGSVNIRVAAWTGASSARDVGQHVGRQGGLSHGMAAFVIFVLFFAALVGTGRYGRITHAQNEALPLISVPSFRNGRVMLPQARETLDVTVTNRSRLPLRDVAVIFIAPESGPSGTFAGATPAGASYFRTRTNASGVASATFIANNQPGVYLVDAVIEGTEAATSFAMTNVARRVTPALTAEIARRTVKEQLLLNTVEDETFRVHGPVLLEPGTGITAAGPSSFLYPTVPVTTNKQAWCFWVDEFPSGKFAHPTRFVLIDASRALLNLTSDVVTTRQGWWPKITLPGTSQSISLLPPAYTRSMIRSSQSALNGVLESTVNEFAINVEEVDTCAILVYGPDLGPGPDNVKNMRNLFEDTLGIPPSNIFTRTDSKGDSLPSRVRDLKQFLDAARDKRCKKLFIYFNMHGSPTAPYPIDGDLITLPGSFQLEQDPEDPDYFNQAGYLSYVALGDLLEPLKETNVEVCLVISSCHSGGVIPYLQNHGVTGTVVTDANAKLPSFAYNAFTDALIECWKDKRADNNPRDGKVTLAEAFAWVLANGGIRAILPDPQVAPINPTTDVFPIPNVVIQKSGDKVTITINRPANVPVTLTVPIRLTIADPAVASFPNSGGVLATEIPAGSLSKSVQICGVHDGMTSYTIEGLGPNNTILQSTATIDVGSLYWVEPNPLMLCVL
jgi:hypothetical protein